MTADSLPEVDTTADLAAERACLGAAIQSALTTLEVAAIVRPGDWWHPRHQAIAEAALALAEAGEPVEPTSVLTELARRGDLVRVGGGSYLHDLVAAASPSWAYSARIVADKADQRALGQAGARLQQFAELAHRGADLDEAIEQARAAVDALAARRAGTSEKRAFADLLHAAIDGYADPIPAGLPTPWPDLDEILGGGGLRPGALTVIGARPGIGKSALAANIARHAAAGGATVLLATLEMPTAEVMDRMLAAEASVDYGRLRDHRLTEHDWQAIDRAADRMRGHRLHLDDDPGTSLATLRARARDHARAGLHLVVLDYLQLMRPADSRVPRQEQVAAMARGAKLLARELDVPVVALSQLNRGPTARANARPTMADLRESGEIENSADQIILLHQDPECPATLDLDVAKNRNGRTGTVRLSWAGHYQRAASLYRGGA